MDSLLLNIFMWEWNHYRYQTGKYKTNVLKRYFRYTISVSDVNINNYHLILQKCNLSFIWQKHFHRYHVICNPIEARHFRSRKSAVLAVLCVWVSAILITLPQLWIQRLQQRLAWTRDPQQPVRIAHVCVEYFSKFAYNLSYSYGFFGMFYLIPFAVMTYAYGRMARVLWLRTHIDGAIASVQVSDKRESQKKNIVRMLIVIILCFILCWSPFFAIHIVMLHSPLNMTLRVCQALALLSGYTNSLINPVIYFFLNAKFKRVVKKILRCGQSSCTGSRGGRYTRKPSSQVTMM